MTVDSTKKENEQNGRPKETALHKLKRIAALIGVILLGGMYIVSAVAALSKSPNAHAVFITTLYCTIAIPVLIYGIMIFAKLADRKKDK